MDLFHACGTLSCLPPSSPTSQCSVSSCSLPAVSPSSAPFPVLFLRLVSQIPSNQLFRSHFSRHRWALNSCDKGRGLWTLTVNLCVPQFPICKARNKQERLHHGIALPLKKAPWPSARHTVRMLLSSHQCICFLVPDPSHVSSGPTPGRLLFYHLPEKLALL